jgi:hypothetical protein
LLDSSVGFVVTQYLGDAGNSPTGERLQPCFRTTHGLVYEPVIADSRPNGRPVFNQLD